MIELDAVDASVLRGGLQVCLSVAELAFDFPDLREFRVGPGGIVVGKVLEEFSGIFTGVPKFTGPESKMIKDTDA